MDSLETEQKHVEKDIDLINGSFSLLFTGGNTKRAKGKRSKRRPNWKFIDESDWLFFIHEEGEDEERFSFFFFEKLSNH